MVERVAMAQSAPLAVRSSPPGLTSQVAHELTAPTSATVNFDVVLLGMSALPAAVPDAASLPSHSSAHFSARGARDGIHAFQMGHHVAQRASIGPPSHVTCPTDRLAFGVARSFLSAHKRAEQPDDLHQSAVV